MLTHGHEDHIGATPYLLRERGDIPLVGSELTLALLGSKLREHRLKETVHHVVKEGDRISLRARSTSSSSRSTTPSPTRSRSRSAPAPGWCCTPATSRWTSCRSTAGSPTCARSRGWGRRASTCSSPTPPTPRPRASRPAEKSITPVIDQVFRDSAAADHRRLLRLPRAPRPAGARRGVRPRAQGRRTSAARWSATWRSPATSATSRSRRACSSTPRTSPTCRPSARC